jgi:hypothetical protein
VVYNTLNYRIFGLCTSSGVLKNTVFWKLNLFPSSAEELGDDLDHWTSDALVQ